MRNWLRKLLLSARTLPILAVARLSGPRISSNPAGNAPHKILILQFNALGDSIMTFPLLRKLFAGYPEARITVVCWDQSEPIFNANPDCHLVHGIRPGRPFSRIVRALALRRQRYDDLIDCTGQLFSACMAKIIGAPQSAGFDRTLRAGFLKGEGRECYTNLVSYSETAHIADVFLRLAPGNGTNEPQEAVFNILPGSKEEANRWLRDRGVNLDRMIVLAPGGKWLPKQWPESHVKALCRRLFEDGKYIPVLVGAGEDVLTIKRICDEVGDIKNLCNAPVQLLAAIIGTARGVVCNDSFIMHLAAVLGRPVVALFGPVDPKRSAPRTSNVKILYTAEFCSPCTLYYSSRRCWRGINFCLQKISPAAVYEAIVEKLK